MNEAERRATSEKYYQELRNKLDERIHSDKQLQKIAEKIANKTADFNDTAKYSEIVSNYIGTVLQENVGEITSPLAKEYVCKELLKDQHSAINELFESVQVSIDERNGIHIKTQKPKFPGERVDKVAHALEDPTVPLRTIKRRANAPVANVSKSFHDDCVRKNAKFRTDAGLKCYIIRIGTKCCEWCSEVAGKYEMGDQPDGIFRRHDNCDCTIIYDGQVLRGKYNTDGVTRGKTWTERGEVPAEYEPTTFTQEQAKELERRNLAQIRGLTNEKNSDKIESREVKPMTISSIDSPIEQRHNGKGNPNAINIFGAELNNRQKQLLEQLADFDSNVIVPKDSVNMADLAALTAETGHEFAMFTKSGNRLIIRGNTNMVNIDIEKANQLAKEGYRWSGHTHPGVDFNCLTASPGDKSILRCFPQNTSVIYNSKGQYLTFDKEE